LSILPLTMIRGKKRINEEVKGIKDDLAVNREKQRAIASKYLGGGRSVGKDDEASLSLLRDKERTMTRREDRLSSVSESCWFKCGSILKPFAVIFGIIFFLFSLFLVVMIFLTQLNRIVNSYCGASCGFLQKYNKILNPMDELLVILSRYFPADYILFTITIVYIFFVTLGGIVHIGVRFLWVHMFRIDYHRTLAQGLLFATVILMFSLVSLDFQLISICPQYLQYGSQTYRENNGSVLPCTPTVVATFDTPYINCNMTQIGQFVNRISLKMGFFGVVFYWVGWVFIICYLIGLIIAFFRSRHNATDTTYDSDSDLED